MMQLWTQVDPWLSFSPSLWPVLFLLLPWEEQVQHCHHVSYTNKQYFVGYCWHVVKPFIAVLMLYSSGAVVQWVLGAVGAPYNGWAWCAWASLWLEHAPSYWSQTFSTYYCIHRLKLIYFTWFCLILKYMHMLFYYITTHLLAAM